MALKIALKPDEKVVINGAVIQNSDRRTNLIIHNKSAILREKDIFGPDQANSPMRRVYFAVMMMYLDKNVEGMFHAEFVQRIAEFINAIVNDDALKMCVEVIEHVHNRDYYQAILLCKKLMQFEEERLSLAAEMGSTVVPHVQQKIEKAAREAGLLDE